MKEILKKVFLQDKFILSIIFINAIIIYLQVKGFENPIINSLDLLCTCIFIVEMLVKLAELGWRGYWKDGWNKLDGILVFLWQCPIFCVNGNLGSRYSRASISRFCFQR